MANTQPSTSRNFAPTRPPLTSRYRTTFAKPSAPKPPPGPADRKFNTEPITPTRKSGATQPTKLKTLSTPIVKKLASNITPKKRLTHVIMDPALKEELEMSELFDVPGLVEHLIPDESLPILCSDLSEAVMETLYDAKEKRWKGCPDLSKYSSTGEEEGALANFLNTFAQNLAEICESKNGAPQHPPRRWCSGQCNIPLPGGLDIKRKPDLILTDKDAIANWIKTMIHLELKSGFANPDVSAAFNQLVNGAYIVFSSQAGRRFHIGVSICRYDVRVYVFDRAGVVGSVPIDMHTEPATFVRLMAGLMFADVSSLGYDPTIIPGPNGHQVITVDNKEYEIMEVIFLADSIRGRGTTCWRVRRDGVEYVIKDLWADKSRGHTEAEILKRAQGIEGVSQIVAEEIVRVNGESDTTARVRGIINRKNYYRAAWLEDLEVRVHRRIVMTPFAVGLTHFATKKELISVLIDAIKAHGHLVEKQVLHRDISLNNIMIYQPAPSEGSNVDGCNDNAGDDDGIFPKKDEPPRRKGLIIDLDYAIFMEEEDRDVATGHRTGTLPFMAIETLLGKEHLPRHDLESLFYVLLWICWNYAGPNNAERQNINLMDEVAKGWIFGYDLPSFEKIGIAKSGHMTSSTATFQLNTLDLFAPYFEDLKDCVVKLREKLFLGPASEVRHQDIIDILEETRKTLPDTENWSWENDKEGYGPTAGKKRKFENNMPAIGEDPEENEEEASRRRTTRKRARTLVNTSPPTTRSQTKRNEEKERAYRIIKNTV